MAMGILLVRERSARFRSVAWVRQAGGGQGFSRACAQSTFAAATKNDGPKLLA
jgi:hypothetical protein